MVLKRVVFGLWLVASGAFLLACAKPARVTVAPKDVLLRDAGASKTLKVSVLDAKGNAMEKVKVALRSSAPEVADVDLSGKVTAKSSGDAVITASAGKVTGAATVRVRIVGAIKLTVPDAGAVGPAGTVVPLTAKASNERGEDADLEGIAFTSSAPAVATVDAKGQVTLLATGKTTVTAAIGKTSATLPLDVTVEVPMAVKVEAQSQTIQLGQTVPLDFTVISDRGRPMTTPVQCTSSDEKVASADATGKVTGNGRGTAVITVHAGPASNTIKIVVR